MKQILSVADQIGNLLPDSEPIRRRLATRFGTGSARAFDMLRAIGRDCVGALQLLFRMLADPDGHARNFSLRILSEGRYSLAPLYDVVSLWPVEGKGASQTPGSMPSPPWRFSERRSIAA